MWHDPMPWLVRDEEGWCGLFSRVFVCVCDGRWMSLFFYGLGIQMAHVQVQYVRESAVFSAFVSNTRVY